MVDTPAVSFANIRYEFDGSVMVTGSHNPVDYNGLKISGRESLVISRSNGLAELEKLSEEPVTRPSAEGESFKLDISDAYLSLLSEYREGVGEQSCVIDCSNGMASTLIQRVVDGLPGSYEIINGVIDGSFPGHGPDPTDEQSLRR